MSYGGKAMKKAGRCENKLDIGKIKRNWKVKGKIIWKKGGSTSKKDAWEVNTVDVMERKILFFDWGGECFSDLDLPSM